MAGKTKEMSLQVTGVLHKVMDLEQITDTFKKQEFVITITEAAYTEYIKFELVQDRCDIIQQYKEGDTISVGFDLRGREWNGKFYVNLRAWKISKEQGGDTQPQKQEPPKNDGEGDDLPF